MGKRSVSKESVKQTPTETGVGQKRSPVHVVYGGADRFESATLMKLGRLAVASVRSFAPNFAVFASAMRLRGAEHLPSFPKAVKQLEAELKSAPEKIRHQDQGAWFAWTVYNKTIEKLKREAIEDFRIDFEDGYGYRSNDEENGHAISASSELATLINKGRNSPFCGLRIKPLSAATKERALRTLDLFLTNLTEKIIVQFPTNLLVTLPKVTSAKQVKELCKRLSSFERKNELRKNTIGVELMIETPDSLIDSRGRVAVRGLVDAAKGRCTSVHFGAFDYTSALGIAAAHQDIRHPACSFARHLMQTALAGTDVRLVDSVTTVMPVPVHRGDSLTEHQKAENRRVVHSAWHRHFENVTNSMIDGFYQSWDLHPNQLPARYAAIYAFFLSEMYPQATRLRGYIDKETKATLTGNMFDDAASVAGLVNFFTVGITCGAFGEDEVTDLVGRPIAEIA